MSLLNSGSRFAACKKMTIPVYKVPKSVQQAVPVSRISKNGVFEIERVLAGNRMYDKVYVFSDINYVSKDAEEKNLILQSLIKILKSMSCNFKFVAANHNRNMEAFKESILYKEDGLYAGLARANNEFILDSLEQGKSDIAQVKYLVVTCYRNSFENAETYFNTLEATLQPLFLGIGSCLQPLDAAERLRVLHDIYRIGNEGEFNWTWEEFSSVRRDWRSDIAPASIVQQDDHSSMRMGDHFVSVLFATQYSTRLDETKVLSELTNGISFHTVTTLDISPVEQLVVKEKLESALVNTEAAIAREQEKKNRSGNFSSSISFPRRQRTREIEEYLEQLGDNDESGYMLGFLIAVFGRDSEELRSNTEQILTIGRQIGIIFEPAEYRQLEAFHTCLPLGAREVDNMRCMLTSSMLAFQPFHTQEIMENGFVYGVNETSKNLISFDRKKLKNSNGFISGASGGGKSMANKIEMGQVVAGTNDDIFIIDPMGEYRDFVQLVGGQYIDFAAESGTRFNVFEVPQELIGCTDEIVIKEFVGSKADIAAALCKEIIAPKLFNGNHLTVVGRCVRLMYEKYFSLPVRKQKESPTMFTFREFIGEQPEADAKDLYTPLETFTQGSLNMFAYPSNVDIDNRVVGFGMESIPKTMKRLAMLIVIHILTQRVQYNQKSMRATWFTVDEAQEVYREELGAEELDRAFRTFRKLGGICTMITQNISTALTNPKVRDMISNSEFKLFMDQGGSDRNAIAQIIELSSDELLRLTNSRIGTGILVCGKKVIKLDGRLQKSSRLYELYSTNFHEKASQRTDGGNSAETGTP